MLGISGNFTLKDNILNRKQKRYTPKYIFKSIKKKTTDIKALRLDIVDNNFYESYKNNIYIFYCGQIYDVATKDVIKFIHNKYKLNGTNGLNHLNGSYLIIIYDISKEELNIITDENNIIPFFYHKNYTKFIFSWDISYITKQVDNLSYNYENLMSWLLIGGRSFLNTTRFKNIYRLEPGEIITIRHGKVTNTKAKYFCFEPSNSNINNLVDDAANALIKAFQKRINHNKNYLIGLSGGLDSRILIGAIKNSKLNLNNFSSYTYGIENFQENIIAQQVSKHIKIRHLFINIDHSSYRKFANDGLFVSSGNSIFKLGIFAHLFQNLSTNNINSSIILGSALDLIAGATHSSEEIYKLKNKSKLIETYKNMEQIGDIKNYLTYNISETNFKKICKSTAFAKRMLNTTEDLLKNALSKIDGDNMSDINDALAFEIRIKRWYNYNLIFPLLTNDLELPTYDKEFLKVIKTIPAHHRKNSVFRTKLLKVLSPELLNINYDVTMQPAWLPSKYAKEFSKVQENIDILKNNLWLEHNKYLPSNRFDANFLEWFRVYISWQKYLDKILIKSNGLINKLFYKDKLKLIINNHIKGSQNNHKIIQFLASLQILDNIFIRKKSKPSNTFKKVIR